MKPLTIRNTKLISRLAFTTLLCGSLIAQSASAAQTPRRRASTATAQPQSTTQPQSRAPRRPRPQTGTLVIPTGPNVNPRPTRPTRPQIDPVPTRPVRPHLNPTPTPRRPRPTIPQNPTVRPRPVQPTFPGRNPLPTGPVDPTPTNPLPTPRNPLPVPESGAPENAPLSDRIVQADEALARDVAGNVETLMNESLTRLDEQLNTLGEDGQLANIDLQNKLQTLIRDGASLREIAEQGRALHDALQSLGQDELAQDVSNTVLLAGISHAIQDAVANGFGPAGPLGPGGFAQGGGPAAGPGAGGPGGFAPGGGGGGGGGVGPGPGGLIPPPPGGGGIGPVGGFNINININLWFGGNGCWPVVCCPCLPWGQCCWIGPNVICCGTGGFGPTWICYGPPAYIGLPYCMVAPLPNALPQANYLGRILLLNPADNLGEIHYLLAGDPFAMEAGMMQEMRRDATVIRFDRGPGFGEARYTLRPGTYRFVVTDHGWDLVKVLYEAILDNTANASEFHLLLDGDPVTIAARSQQTVTSDFPPTVEFSNGSEVVRKQLADEKTYTIGINDSGLWDLFPGDAIASGAGEVEDVQLIAAAEGVEPPHAIDLPTE